MYEHKQMQSLTIDQGSSSPSSAIVLMSRFKLWVKVKVMGCETSFMESVGLHTPNNSPYFDQCFFSLSFKSHQIQ